MFLHITKQLYLPEIKFYHRLSFDTNKLANSNNFEKARNTNIKTIK